MAGSIDSPGFGNRLTTATVEQLLGDTRKERDLWRREHARDVQDIRAVVSCFAPRDVVMRLHIAKPSDEVCTKLAALTR